jgi:two-component sensor histidine kinase
LNAPLGSNLSQSAPPDEKPAFQVFSDGELMHPDDLPMQRAASTGRRVGRSECEIRFADGRRMFIAGHCIPITNDLGEVCGSIGAFVDVTERHVRHERDGLIAREMSHRVKNTVSLIQAMAHSTISNKLEAADYEAFEQRLIALAKAQDLIAETKTANVTLDELIRSSISLVAEAQMGRVQISGPEVWVRADLVQQLSMVFHELTTNACKYGALGNQGRLTVKWSSRDSTVSLEWRETCVAAPTTRSGFGSALIKSILRNQAKGELVRKFADGELLIRLSFLT